MIRKLWTDEKPKTGGYYWLKTPDGNAQVVVIRRNYATSVSTQGGICFQGRKLRDVEGKWCPIRFPSLHDANRHETQLKQLSGVVTRCLAELDAVMKLPESNERGKRIAAIANALDNANQAARIFGLQEPLRG